MKIVSFVNQKGGCGKTLTAVNLGWALASKGYKILLVDFDPQAHATFSLGITPENTIADILESVINSSPINLEKSITQRGDTFWVIPSSIGLSATEQSIAQSNSKLDTLSKLLNAMPIDFDYCFIDCPPNLGVLTLNALIASNYAIIPMSICELSLQGVGNLQKILGMITDYRERIPTLFYLITQYDKRSCFANEFMERAQNNFGKQLFNSSIRNNIHLRVAASEGKSIFEYKTDSRGAQDYQALANEFENLTKSSTWINLSLKGKEMKNVFLVGDFNGWQKKETYRMKRLDLDTWIINIPLKKGEYRYKFVVDNQWITDPHNKMVENDSYGGKNSILKVQ